MARYTFQKDFHGAGGFAKVIRGRDNELDRDIAIKVLDPITTQFPEKDQLRFRQEAKFLAKLSHPNIPAIYDVDFEDGRFQIIFQFIDGQTLRQMLEESGPCPIESARRWFHQIASALDHAHRLKLIHRDIKPANIIITPDGESAYLVDFGIAISIEDGRRLTGSGYAVGTPGYMSPEQYAGKDVDERTDIYSLGVTLYEALSGKLIHPGPAYVALSTINEAIPPHVDDLILECLEERPRRLSSAKTFASQLAGAFRIPSKPFSEVLGQGKLHELTLALDPMTANDIAQLPGGQRDLLLEKIIDLADSDEPNLQYPTERLLQLMVTRGVLLDRKDYREIVKPAIARGFDAAIGRATLRDALEEAAFNSREDAHSVLMEEFIPLFKGLSLDDKERWFLHGVREIIAALMANPSCSQSSTDLRETLRAVNKIQRSRGEHPLYKKALA